MHILYVSSSTDTDRFTDATCDLFYEPILHFFVLICSHIANKMLPNYFCHGFVRAKNKEKSLSRFIVSLWQSTQNSQSTHHQKHWLEEEVPDEGSDIKFTKLTLTQNGQSNTPPTNKHSEPNHLDIKRYRHINNNTNINNNRHGGRVFVRVLQNNS